MKRLFFLLSIALALLLPRPVLAQIEPPTATASAEPSDVEVGEPFAVSLNITVDTSAPSPSDPRIAVPEGLRAGPPSIATQTQISIMNGRLSRRSGITATWQVVATREGVFTIPAPHVAWNGRRVAANPVRVTVRAQGSGRGRRPPSGMNPFDPFGMFPRMPGFFDPPDTPAPAPEPPPDPELSLDAPLDSRVFLRSVVDQKSAVVGQQVTLKIYLYARLASIEVTDVHEPSIPDFLRRDLMPAGHPPEAKIVSINGVPWQVQPLFKVALFPLHAGDLEIGPMRITLVGGRGSGIGTVVRESLPLHLRAVEPPGKGRPVGYQVGDVGAYSLSANVEPRATEVGGAIGVTVTLEGTGNVPNAIRVPTSSALEWLDPQTRERSEIQADKIRGSRTFTYVVRPKTAGAIDLGEVTLPYWSPEHRAYEIARTQLGKIQVEPSKNPVAAAPVPESDPWAALGRPRDRLGETPRPRLLITDHPLYWLGLFGAPFALVLGSLGSRGVTRVRTKLVARRESTERAIDEALAQAREARRRDDRAALASALERALHLAILRATGLKSRALLIDEVPAALAERSVAPELAAEIKALLSAIETLRFVPDAAPRADELTDKVAAAVKRLGRISPPEKR